MICKAEGMYHQCSMKCSSNRSQSIPNLPDYQISSYVLSQEPLSEAVPSGPVVVDQDECCRRTYFKSRRRSRSSDAILRIPAAEIPSELSRGGEGRVAPTLSCDSGYGDCAHALSPSDFGGESVTGEEIWATHSTPCVVISDCSDVSPVPPDAPACLWSYRDSLTLTLPLKDPGFSLGRRYSDCSSCSSFGSLDVDPTPSPIPSTPHTFFRVLETGTGNCTSDDLPEETVTFRKSSQWRKVRSAVQWTPFIQTFRRQRYPWVQLAGHQDNFKLGGEHGTILKKLCVKEEQCFKLLMQDPLRPFVPQYKGQIVSDEGESFIVLEDLLGEFQNPCVMDCKMGVRTYLEDELAKAKLKPKFRRDMYDKMVEINPEAPTDEEKRIRGVTKPRYMVWRETISSTATMGFRIEGIRKEDGKSSKDFKTLRNEPQLLSVLRDFVSHNRHALYKYIDRLENLKSTLSLSDFFASHELIGSSLLFIHDSERANVWMIDFAKTCPLPPGITISHRKSWDVGNHEDGYLIGLDNLIQFFHQLLQDDPLTNNTSQ